MFSSLLTDWFRIVDKPARNHKESLEICIEISTFEFSSESFIKKPKEIPKGPVIFRQFLFSYVRLNCRRGINGNRTRSINFFVPFVFDIGVGGQVDFLRGAAICPDGGKPILALSSRTKNGQSKIVPFIKQGNTIRPFGICHWHATSYLLFALLSLPSYAIMLGYSPLIIFEMFTWGYVFLFFFF